MSYAKSANLIFTVIEKGATCAKSAYVYFSESEANVCNVKIEDGEWLRDFSITDLESLLESAGYTILEHL